MPTGRREEGTRMDQRNDEVKQPIDVAAMFPAVNQIADAKLRAAADAVWQEL